MDLNRIIEERCLSKSKLAKKVNLDDSTLNRYLKNPPRGAVDFMRLLLALDICPLDYVNSVTMSKYECKKRLKEEEKGKED